jgi:hypothetical protein
MRAFKEIGYGNEKRKGRNSVREKLKRFRDEVSQNKYRERRAEKKTLKARLLTFFDFYSQLYSQRVTIIWVGNKSWVKEHINGYKTNYFRFMCFK